jgi:putative aldouronate transport system substrate-binding protein
MKRIHAILLALMLLTALFSGCDSAGSGEAATPDSVSAPVESAETTQASPYNFAAGKFQADENGLATEKYEYVLPLSTTDEEFTYWFSNFTPEYLPEEGYGATELPTEVSQRTGVNIDYVVVSYETMAENFSVMLSADDLCDVTCNAKGFYAGNFRDAIGEDGYFVNIYDYRAYMPNYIYEATKDPPDIDTLNTVFTESDLILSVYELKKEPQLTDGPFARGDWLAKMGKTNTDIVTFEDLHEALLYFKTQIGAEHPMTLYKSLEVVGCNEWVGYDTYCFVSDTKNVYVKDGAVQLANINENDYELMSMISKWYDDGLIDPNWSSYTARRISTIKSIRVKSAISSAAASAFRAQCRNTRGCAGGLGSSDKTPENRRADPAYGL